MKIVVFYYSQSGQAYDAVESMLSDVSDCSVIYKQIIPQQAFPYPWSMYEFFDTFPETRLGISPFGIQEIDLSDVENVDLVIIAGQSWYLSPSLPLQSFLANEQVKSYLNGRRVIFVNVCRNMWLMTIRQIKKSLENIGAVLVGHIVLQDNHPNLISAATVVRWLIHGRKDASKLLPKAGVSDEDINNASLFGNIITQSFANNKIASLQKQLLIAGAIKYKPSILYIEKIGYRMFGIWANFIRKRGDFRDPHRKRRVQMFYYYLIIVLFLISPFAQFLFYLTYPLHQVDKNKQNDCDV